MQTKNKMFDDLSQLMTNAMGVAQGAKEEAENAMKSLIDRWLAEQNFVTREEFDALCTRHAALAARLALLESMSQFNTESRAKTTAKAKPISKRKAPPKKNGK